MNADESCLRYPHYDALPECGRTLTVAAGIKWIRMGLPFALDYMNLWLLRDTLAGVNGWTVVDCYVDLPQTRAQWEQRFEDELEGLPIIRVFATHMYPDHLGLARWLCERWDGRLWSSATDYCTALAASSGTLFRDPQVLGDFCRSHGVPDAAFHERLSERESYYPALVPKLPVHFHRVMDGDVVQIGDYRFELIAGYGHAPEHMALSCPAHNLSISGDMVRPRISTNVSVFAGDPESDPLRLFLNSLGRYASLPQETPVLPSYGKPVTGLHERLAQLHIHDDAQLAQTQAACFGAAVPAADSVPVLFRRTLDSQQLTFAVGEALAYLHYLWCTGAVTRVLGAENVYRFQRT